MIAEAKEDRHAVSERELCRLFSVSRSWYRQRPSPEGKAAKDVALKDAIERIVLKFPGYGYRRVTEELHRRGWAVNHKRVSRVMRRESLLCRIERRFKPTTDSTHSLRRYPNLLKEALIDAPDTAWSADITYVRLPTSFCYLASIIDEFSRYRMGFSLSRWVDTRLTLEAIEMALAARRPEPGLIHHSDQGVQYASGEYVARLEQSGARISMAAVTIPTRTPKPRASSGT